MRFGNKSIIHLLCKIWGPICIGWGIYSGSLGLILAGSFCSFVGYSGLQA